MVVILNGRDGADAGDHWQMEGEEMEEWIRWKSQYNIGII
jgi:hypothetical protein